MSDLCVIVPTRSRPANIARLIQGWEDTGATAHLLIVLDEDDPTLEDYDEVLRESRGHEYGFLGVIVAPRKRLGPTLNHEAIAQAQRWAYVGFAGDDHYPRTVGWDDRIADNLDNLGSGIVYGNDLFQGPNLPTAVFMTSDVIRTLGYMCPPGLIHLFLDNAWKAWGEGMGRLRYLPEVIIEHLHPQADGKAEWDEGYSEVNGGAMWAADSEAWEAYKADRLAEDIEKLRSLL